MLLRRRFANSIILCPTKNLKNVRSTLTSAPPPKGTDDTTNNTAGRSVKKTVNLNTATKEELVVLPGIGESTAEQILIYRDEHSEFSSVEQLRKIKGIGPKEIRKTTTVCENQMKSTERRIALILEQSQITAVEIAQSPKGHTLTAAGSFNSSLNFDDQDMFSQPGASQRERGFAQELQTFFKNIGSGSRTFAFGLNSRMIVVQSIPTDASLSESDLDEHSLWELSHTHLSRTPTHSMSAHWCWTQTKRRR